MPGGMLPGGPSDDVLTSEMICEKWVPAWDIPKKGGHNIGAYVPVWDVPGKSNRLINMGHRTNLSV